MAAKRILLLAFGLSGGGAQAVCRHWAEGLSKTNFVSVAVLDRVGEVPVQGHNYTAIDISLHAGRSHWRRVAWLRNHLSHESYDLVISLETYPNILALLAVHSMRRRSKRPFLTISEHNVPSILMRNEHIAQAVQLRLGQIVYRRADHCIAVSHAVATDLVVNFAVKANRLSVLPNPVLPTPSFSNRILRRQRTPKVERLRILVPARLVPQKRPEFGLEIAEHVRQTVPEVEFFWIGDSRTGGVGLPGSRTIKVRQLAWTESWISYCDDYTVVLLPSFVEGLGNVLIEAANAGIPAVAGSLALGCSDAIIPGVTGELAETDSVASYAAAIVRATQKDPNSLESWLGRFQSDVVSRQLQRVLGLTAEQTQIIAEEGVR